MASKNIYVNFILLYLLSIDSIIFALRNSNNLLIGDHLPTGSLRRIDHKGFKFRHKTGDKTNSFKAVNNLLRMFYPPSVAMPRTQFITKDFRQKVYGKLFTRKENRPTRAGYTTDADTCNLYNENLENLWKILSPYIAKDQETPNDMALHNIALLISAYLEHADLIYSDNSNTTENARKRLPREAEDTDELIDKINDENIFDQLPELLFNNLDEITPDEIIAAIENKVSSDTKDEKCLKESKEKLKRNVYHEYRKYLNHTNCFNITSDEINRQTRKQRKVFQQMSFDQAKEFVKQWTNNRKVHCKIIAKERFLQAMKAIIQVYSEDLQCITPILK